MEQRWTSAYYRTKARRAVEEARSTASAARRDELLEIARNWELLAAGLEKQLEGSLPLKRRRRRGVS
jgi:hypothetical protein